MNYEFRKIGTEEYFQIEMPMGEREQWLKDNPDMEQVLRQFPAMVDPIKLGRMNPAMKDFQKNVVGRMRDSIPNNNLRDSKFQVPREI